MRKRNIRTEISEYLEENANDVERVNGYDIADYLIKVKSGEAVLQSMTRKNPALKLLIETFDLELSELRFRYSIKLRCPYPTISWKKRNDKRNVVFSVGKFMFW